MSGLRSSFLWTLVIVFFVAAVHPVLADDDDDDDKGKGKKRRKDMFELVYVAPPVVGLPEGLKAIAFIPFSQAVEDKEGVYSAREKRWGDEITAAIAQRMQDYIQAFKLPLSIVDRSAVVAIMKEKDLADAGLAQENKALQLGKLAKAEAICFGQMTVSVHKEEGVSKTFRPTFTQVDQVVVRRDPRRPHRRYITRGTSVQGGIEAEPVRQIRRTITLSATVKLVATGTGKSIVTFSRRLMDTTEKKPSIFMGESAQEIQLRPEDQVIERLFNQLVEEFVAQILPHEIRMEVKLCNPKNKISRAGLKFLQTGNFEKAIEFLNEGIAAKPDDHAALYDLGVAYEATGQPKQALKHYELACRIKDQDLYIDAARRVRQKASVLAETATPATAPAGQEAPSAVRNDPADPPLPK